MTFMSTIYLVHTAFIGAKSPSDAVFSLVIFRPRIAGGNLTIPIDSGVRLVKCSRREASHNTIRLRYGKGKDRKCTAMRAVDSLEREKWLVGLIQAMAAAGSCTPSSTVLQTASEDSSHTSDDTISSFLSTIYLVRVVSPSASQTTFNLVVQRPRVAGGTLTIPLNSTVQILSAVRKDREQHDIIRLQYGAKATHLVMRAVSAHDRKQWIDAISAAISKGEEVRQRSCTTPRIATQFTSRRTKLSRPSPNPTRFSHEHDSFRRVVRHNIPPAMQFIITVGQIIASVR
ncbi:hypothetical protein P3T76_000874 [Phytophthora citrophthora]|uniref:PH domain-containing protein n=1 Tax=Phytophthora citrophthora TaxID=4793 RepID=A0AAD9H221_9STRA|nr:hypothetical protein P3T76_000874 [Phytophthora citrophthora]